MCWGEKGPLSSLPYWVHWCGPENKGPELSNTLILSTHLFMVLSWLFMDVVNLIVPFLWPCVVFVSPRGRINTCRKAFAPKLLCPIPIRLYRGGPPHFGNMIPAVRGTLEFTNVPGGRRPTEHVLPMSCLTCLGAFINSFETPETPNTSNVLFSFFSSRRVEGLYTFSVYERRRPARVG